MKQISTLVVALFCITLFSNAQFTENFDGTVAPCSQMSTGTASILTNGSNKYLGFSDKNTGDYTTPYIKPSSTNITVNFDYWFSNNTGNPTRTLTITIAGVSKSVNLVPSTSVNTVSLNFTITDINIWQQVKFALTGDKGNATIVGVDNIVISGLTSQSSCSDPSPIALPIKLQSFDAKYQAPNVILNWSTAQEKNFSHFEIETSSNGFNFMQAGVVFGNGDADTQKNYSYDDKNVKANAVIYYRLKSVDNDGKFTYSAVRIIRTAETVAAALSAFPNPMNAELRVSLPANWQGKDVKVELFNGNGQKVMESDHSNASQTEVFAVNTIRKGLYIVKATCGKETASQKIMKN